MTGSIESTVSTIGIIGNGRFGALIAEIISSRAPKISVRIFSRSVPADGQKFFEFSELSECDVVIPAVPIHAFEGTLRSISPYLRPGMILVDVCSVKIHPKKVIQDLLPEGVQAVLTHPMFGPATYEKSSQSLEGLTIVLENISCAEDFYESFKTLLVKEKLKVVELDADSHDKMAARFHFVALYTSSVLKELDLERSSIDTKSFRQMLEFMEMIGIDRALVRDTYRFNPYAQDQLKRMREVSRELDAFIEEGQ